MRYLNLMVMARLPEGSPPEYVDAVDAVFVPHPTEAGVVGVETPRGFVALVPQEDPGFWLLCSNANGDVWVCDRPSFMRAHVPDEPTV